MKSPILKRLRQIGEAMLSNGSKNHIFWLSTAIQNSAVAAMTKSRRQELSDIFTEQWQRARDWLIPLMQNNQPKVLTKDELRSAAMRGLGVSKNAFDFGWMAAIEDTGRHDWYEPLRKRPRPRN
jgi:hypothetical protein